MRKGWIIGLGAIVALFALAYLGSPYLAARDFVATAKKGDAAALGTAVDFPAVRDSLKPQLTAAINTRMRNDPAMRGNPLAGLGMMLVPTILDRMVDSIVTADGIAALVRAGKVVRPGNGTAAAAPPVDYDYQYVSIDRFRVTLRKKGGGDPVDLIFGRRGLFWWKLVGITLPQQALTAPDAPDAGGLPPGDDVPDDGAPADPPQPDTAPGSTTSPTA